MILGLPITLKDLCIYAIRKFIRLNNPGGGVAEITGIFLVEILEDNKEKINKIVKGSRRKEREIFWALEYGYYDLALLWSKEKYIDWDILGFIFGYHGVKCKIITSKFLCGASLGGHWNLIEKHLIRYSYPECYSIALNVGKGGHEEIINEIIVRHPFLWFSIFQGFVEGNQWELAYKFEMKYKKQMNDFRWVSLFKFAIINGNLGMVYWIWSKIDPDYLFEPKFFKLLWNLGERSGNSDILTFLENHHKSFKERNLPSEDLDNLIPYLSKIGTD